MTNVQFLSISLITILFSCSMVPIHLSAQKNQLSSNIKVKETYQLAMAGLEECLKNDEYSKLEPFLSEQFQAGDYTTPAIHQVIPQILKQYPNLISLQIKEVKKHIVSVDLVFDLIGASTSTISFDENDKITSVTLFDDILGMSAAADSESFEKVESFRVPFEIVGSGLIMVKVKLNGIEEDFILDSGAPAMIINTNAKEGESSIAQGVAGQVSMSEVKIESFDWGGIRCGERIFIGMDLSHLEDAIDRPFKGLIGFTAIENYIIFIDYDSKTLLLTSKIEDLGAIESSFPFEYQGHIPVIKMKTEKKEYSIGLDTGAESNLLSIQEYRNFEKTQLKILSETDLIGADGNLIKVDHFTINNLSINKMIYSDMQFVASDISHLTNGYGLEIVGLLGFPFLNQKKVAIDFENQQLHFLK